MIRFAADVHLGRLARLLRMLGFDTLWMQDASNAGLQRIAARERRLLLTRTKRFIRLPGVWVVHIADPDPEQQLRQLAAAFPLQNEMRPFTRCMACNACLEPVTKEAITDQLPARTAAEFDIFRYCPGCGRTYWEGSHFERMLRRIRELLPG